MGQIIYVIGLWLYELIVRIAAIFNPKAKKFIDGRNDAWRLLKNQLEGNTSKILWVHCSSVGEYEQGRPVMEQFKKEYTQYKILVTFYSPSGYEAIPTDDIVDFKSYLPFDSNKNAQRFIKEVNPSIVFFVKYEFWYFYLTGLKAAAVPTYSISSIFRRQQVYFKWYGSFYKKILTNFNHFFVQDERSQVLLNKLNLSNTITGDTRLDRVIDLKDEQQEMPEIATFCADHEVMIVGSMRKEDLNLVIEFVKLHPDLKFIIAPHEITESMIKPLEKDLSSVIRYSIITSSLEGQRVLIIDNIGLLSKLYRYATYTYIGGGFSDGLHNILEPAVFGKPVFFGNKAFQKYKEAIDFIDLGVAFPVGSLEEFATVFNHLQNDKARQAGIKKLLDSYLESNSGASQKIIRHIKNFIP